MPKLEEELQSVLNSISKFLVSLSTQVDNLQKQVNKLQEDKQVKLAPKVELAPKAKKVKKKTEVKKIPASKKASNVNQPTLLGAVYNVIKRSRNGATIEKIIEKTDIAPKQLSNALYKLTKKNKIAAKSRGVYIKK